MHYMANTKKGAGRSKRRQPRKGFPFRVVTYLDAKLKSLLEDALSVTGENASMFIAKALAERARKVLKTRP